MELDIRSTAKTIAEVALKDLGAYGSFIFYAVVAASTLTLGDFMLFSKLAVSLVAVTTVIIFFRLAYRKARPGMKKRAYRTIYETADSSSFPSIHAARATMLSVLIFSKLPAMLPVAAFLLLAVCASRIYFKRHDMIDITAGIVLGLALGWAFFLAF